MKLLITRPLILLLLLGCADTKEPIAQIENVNQQSKPIEDQMLSYVKDIPLPKGYELVNNPEKSFAEYLSNLPLKQSNNDVYLYNGKLKENQEAHYKIIDMDIGQRDLQQCADAVMRLRAEHLYEQKEFDQLKFKLASGKMANYLSYVGTDRSYSAFRKYMNHVFSYANTRSLKSQLTAVSNLFDIHPGDVFIQSGNPYGHAVIVISVAQNKSNGKRIFMMAQSYMPAQEIEVLINPNDSALSPWYEASFDGILYTPEWKFKKSDLRRF